MLQRALDSRPYVDSESLSGFYHSGRRNVEMGRLIERDEE